MNAPAEIAVPRSLGPAALAKQGMHDKQYLLCFRPSHKTFAQQIRGAPTMQSRPRETRLRQDTSWRASLPKLAWRALHSIPIMLIPQFRACNPFRKRFEECWGEKKARGHAEGPGPYLSVQISTPQSPPYLIKPSHLRGNVLGSLQRSGILTRKIPSKQ